MSNNQLKYYSDIILFVSFVLINIPQASGIPFHEWISFIFIIPLFVHILIDWKWVVNITKRIFKMMSGEIRFNYILDLLIYIVMVFVMLSGVVISEAALPALGFTIVIDTFWSVMHHLSANLLMILIGIHLAMHWSWIKRNLFRRQPRSRADTSQEPGKS